MKQSETLTEIEERYRCLRRTEQVERSIAQAILWLLPLGLVILGLWALSRGGGF